MRLPKKKGIFLIGIKVQKRLVIFIRPDTSFLLYSLMFKPSLHILLGAAIIVHTLTATSDQMRSTALELISSEDRLAKVQAVREGTM